VNHSQSLSTKSMKRKKVGTHVSAVQKVPAIGLLRKTTTITANSGGYGNHGNHDNQRINDNHHTHNMSKYR
jgi:hypothetical protein